MSKRIIFSVAVVALVASLIVVNAVPIMANGGICDNKVSSSEQGNRQNGSPITDTARTDPDAALGEADGFFFSLGFGGSIVLEFPEPVGCSLTVYETTWGRYPPETATVEVSNDGTNWTLIGTADNATGQPGKDPHPTTLDFDGCIRYVRITDTTDKNDFKSRPTADAFDLDAVCGEPCPLVKVPVDIKPTSCPNPLNLKSKGVLPVAILGTEDLDVSHINPDTVLLEGIEPLRWSIEDVATPFNGEIEEGCCECCTTAGPDGYADLTLKFDRQKIVAALGEEIEDGGCVLLTLTGSLKDNFGGTSIEGLDVVKIIKKGKNGNGNGGGRGR